MQPILITQPTQLAAIQSQAAELEAFAKGPAQSAVGRRLDYYNALSAIAGGSLNAWISDGNVIENEQANQEALNVARSLRVLDLRKAVLVPWQNADSNKMKFAMAARDVGMLESSNGLGGLWTVLAVAAGITLFLVEPGAALIGAGIYLVDAYLAYQTVEANARETLARTQENLSNAYAQAQKRGDTAQADAILAAMKTAEAAAANSNPGWMDSILGTVKDVAKGAVGGFAGAGAVLLLLFFMERGKQPEHR